MFQRIGPGDGRTVEFEPEHTKAQASCPLANPERQFGLSSGICSLKPQLSLLLSARVQEYPHRWQKTATVRSGKSGPATRQAMSKGKTGNQLQEIRSGL